MAYNGSGTFQRVHSWATDKTNNVKITASRMDAEDDGFAAGLTNCITKDGQTTVTANIPFNSKRITGLGDATADTDALNRQTADARYAAIAAEQTVQGTCHGRLTLTSGTAVTTSDVTAGTTLYFTPHHGNSIGLYDGSAGWDLLEFSELSLSLSGLTADTNYDVFVYNNSGTAAIDTLVAWSSDTARATAITLQDGVYVQSGATTRRYVGTIRTTATTGQCADSLLRRYVWNADRRNRVLRPMQAYDVNSSWGYSTAAWRQARSNTDNQLNWVQGLAEDGVTAILKAACVNSTATARNVRIGLGLDTVAAPTDPAITLGAVSSDFGAKTFVAHYSGVPAVGRHYLAWLEYGAGSDTQTWSGYSSGAFWFGIQGEVWA